MHHGDEAWSTDRTQIVFVSDRDGNQEIYLMNATGSGVLKVTNDSGADCDSSWSPYGSTIAFTFNCNGSTDIYAINLDGTGITRLTLNE